MIDTNKQTMTIQQSATVTIATIGQQRAIS